MWFPSKVKASQERFFGQAGQEVGGQGMTRHVNVRIGRRLQIWLHAPEHRELIRRRGDLSGGLKKAGGRGTRTIMQSC